MNTTEPRTLPSGDYPFTVTAFERGKFAGNDKTPSCYMAVLTIEIDGGELGTMLIQDHLLLHRCHEWKLSQFFTAIGQRGANGRVRMDWNAVPGACGVVRLVRDSAVMCNHVEGYIDQSPRARTATKKPADTTSADELRSLTVQLLGMIQDAQTLAALYARANRAFVTDGREC